MELASRKSVLVKGEIYMQYWRKCFIVAALAALTLGAANGNVVPLFLTIQTVQEGNAFRLTTIDGNDIPNFVLGSLGLCDPGGPDDLCNANTPVGREGEGLLGQSDKVIWVAINNAAGVRVGTGIMMCSDPGDARDNNVTSPEGWNNPVNCQGTPWANLTRYMFEVKAVDGIETTMYTPGNNQPGFLPGNNPWEYELVSDIPEPSFFILFSSAFALLLFLKLVGAFRRGNRGIRP
jgi:hypothetical protein